MPDVNVFVYAHRRDVARGLEHRQWLQSALGGPEHVGVSELVLSAFLRIVTNHRIFVDPTPLDRALEFCATVRSARRAVSLAPSPRHWRLFTELCTTVSARANVVPDAYLAALAMDHGATLITADRGFARFPGLAWRPPLEDPSATQPR